MVLAIVGSFALIRTQMERSRSLKRTTGWLQFSQLVHISARYSAWPTAEQHIITVPAKPTDRTVKLFKLATTGAKTPKLDGVQALYVYGDLVDYQFVGDMMVPLLTLVDVDKSPGERVGHM